MMTKPPQRAHGTLALTVLFLVACGPPTPSSGGGSSRDAGVAAQPDGGVEQPGEDAGTTGRPDAGAALAPGLPTTWALESGSGSCLSSAARLRRWGRARTQHQHP